MREERKVDYPERGKLPFKKGSVRRLEGGRGSYKGGLLEGGRKGGRFFSHRKGEKKTEWVGREFQKKQPPTLP